MNDKGKLKSPSLVSKQLKIVRATKLSNKNKAKIIIRPGRFSDTAPLCGLWFYIKSARAVKKVFDFCFCVYLSVTLQAQFSVALKPMMKRE